MKDNTIKEYLSLLMKVGRMNAWVLNLETGLRSGIIGATFMPYISTKGEYLAALYPDDAAIITEEVEKMKRGEIDEIHKTIRVRPGLGVRYDYIELYCAPIKENGIIKEIATIYKGVSDEIYYRKQLDDNNVLLKTVMDRMPCVFFMKDVGDDYRYLIANRLFCEKLGLPENEVVGKTDYDLMSTGEEADQYRKDDEDAVENEIKSVREVTMWRGRRSVWHTTKTLLVTSEGKRFLLGMALDITSVDESIEQLREAKDKAERLDVLKSSFLANMSHEIRTPLNSIVGFSELLSLADDSNEKREYVNIISHNSRLLIKLINDILDLSKMDAGYIDFKNEFLDLSRMFDEFKITFTAKIKDNIDFVCSNPYSVCTIQSDKDRLSQVVNNYMSNAIKYTASGSIVLGYEVEDCGVRIYVTDTGIGISEEDRERVFGRFEKFDSFAQGTGLGLSICKEIVETMGGKVGFESEKGKGSTFWALIPCSPVCQF